MNTQEKLDALALAQAQLDTIRLHYDDRRKAVMTPEIIAALAMIDAEQSEAMSAAQAGIDALTAEIKADVLAAGETIKSKYIMAVYSKGRVTWDGKLLEGLMIAVPALAQARKEGEPSVSFRAVK